MWGGLASRAPVVYRRNWRVANPPQDGILPHGPSSRSVSPERLSTRLGAPESRVYTEIHTEDLENLTWHSIRKAW